MKVIGLTGGIGMGKSTAAAAFRRARIPVFDADATVHALQARNGRALPAIARQFPGTVANGVLNRPALRALVLADRSRLRQLSSSRTNKRQVIFACFLFRNCSDRKSLPMLCNARPSSR